MIFSIFLRRLCLLLVLLAMPSAYGTLLESRVIEAQTVLSKNLQGVMGPYLKDIPYFLKVKLNFEDAKLARQIIKTTPIASPRLPGLTKSSSTALRQLRLSQVTSSEIFRNVDSVAVDISIRRKFSDKVSQKVKTLISTALEPYKIREILVSVQSAVIKFDVEAKPVVASKVPIVEENPVLSILIAIGSIALLGILVFWGVIRSFGSRAAQISSSISDAGQSILASSATSGPALLAQSSELTPRDPSHKQSNARSDELYDKVKTLLEVNPTLASLICSYFFQSQRHSMIFVVLGFLGEEKRNEILKAQASEYYDAYLKFLREDGYGLTSNSELMSECMISIHKMLLMGQQDPESLFGFFIRDSISMFGEGDYRDFMSRTTPSRAACLFELLGPDISSDLISTGKINVDQFSEIITSENDGHSSYKEVYEDLALFIGARKPEATSEREAFIATIGTLLPVEQERELYRSSLSTHEAKLSEVSIQDIPTIMGFAKKLSIADTAELLATLEQDLEEQILEHLPEIKRNQVRAQKSALTQKGRKLKSELTSLLSSHELRLTDGVDEEDPFEQSA